MTSDFFKIKNELPVLGIGLGLRRELETETLENQDRIDWLEIVPENYMDIGGSARTRLQAALDEFPIVTHGVNLSIGSCDELNKEYLASLKRLLDFIDAPWFTDHLCFTSQDGVYMHDLLPVPQSKEAVKHVSERIKRVQDYIERPLLLENISYYMEVPGCEIPEAQFLSLVLETGDCGLLLDVNNVYVNSINLNFDPYKYLDSLPLDRIVHMHVAGHGHGEQAIIDTHGAPVIEPVYDLLEYVLKKVPVNAVMLERDQNFPQFEEILAELDEIRAIADQVQPALSAVRESRNKKQRNKKNMAPDRKSVNLTHSAG